MSGVDLAGRVAVVTGARRGIGAAVVRTLLDHGATVVACGRDADSMHGFATSMQAYGNCLPFGGDLGRVESRDRLAAVAPDVDILVNNAGGFLRAATTSDCEQGEWDQQLALNLTVPFLLIQLVLRGMIERRWGRIVNIGSVVATTPQAGNSVAYVAAKAGLLGLSRQIALEVAGTGVTVNVVNPGAIGTEHLRDYFAASTDVTESDLAGRIPMGRLGTADEVAAVIPFLVSDAGGYTTGAAIDINGGVIHA